MPNWCATSFVVEGDKKEVHDLFAKMKSLEEREESLVENGFGKTWLGNLVTLLGGDWNTIYCRGEWIWMELNENVLRFDTESAWSPPLETINFIKEKYPSLNFYYMSEEPGMGDFLTNDKEGKYFSVRYAIDYQNELVEYDANKLNSFLREIKEITGKDVKSAKEAYEAVYAYNENVEDDDFLEIKIYKVI